MYVYSVYKQTVVMIFLHVKAKSFALIVIISLLTPGYVFLR